MIPRDRTRKGVAPEGETRGPLNVSVIYTGHMPEIDVPVAGSMKRFTRGKPDTLPRDIAENLLQRADWKREGIK